ncbi:MAG: hypothetical protein AAGA48_25150 [Myxococcota bacterium]
MGRSLTLPMASLPKKAPHRALVIAEGVGAMCAEIAAWDFELEAEKARVNYGAFGEARTSEIIDAQIRAQRQHALAAERFERSYRSMVEEFGPTGEDTCQDVPDRHHFVYQFGLITGVLALFHDRASGGAVGVPLDRPQEIARATLCLDDTAWWGMAKGLRGASWATIPGSEPEDVDPWQMMAEAADNDTSGVRVARAIQVLLASNAGREDIVEAGIRKFVEAGETLTADPDWVLLDEYAETLVRHQSDLLWMKAKGHRTERLGVLPSDDEASAPDPFEGADPFGDGADPFAGNNVDDSDAE